MNELKGVLSAAAEVEAFCRQQGWKFCFIGGVAVQRWGIPRFTQDVDLTLLTGFGSESTYIDAVLSRFKGRLRDTRTFALQHRVLLAQTAGGIDLDFAFGALPFEEQAVERASEWKVKKSASITTCSAEDLVVHKSFAGRDRDWADVEGVLTRQHGKLDLSLVRRALVPLLEMKEDTGSLGKLERIVAKVDERFARGEE